MGKIIILLNLYLVLLLGQSIVKGVCCSSSIVLILDTYTIVLPSDVIKKGSFGDDLHNIRIPRPKGAANTNEARNYDTHVCIIMYLKASVIFLPLYFCRLKIQSLNPFAPCHFQIINELLLNFENISMLLPK